MARHRTPNPPRVVTPRVIVTPLPGAPRERRVAPITAMRRPDTLRDDLRPCGVNGHAGHVYGSPVAAVTGRKSRKSPGWSSRIAGGHTITAPGV